MTAEQEYATHIVQLDATLRNSRKRKQRKS
jgi:hypothetical protein